MNSDIKIIAACFLLFLATSPAQAATYKCTDAQGSVEFSQMPCASGQQSKQMTLGSSTVKVDAELCEMTGKFVTDVYRDMRRGMDSQSQIARHGGVGYINASLLNMINYAYTFRHNERASAMRIASLSRAKCSNGGFGKFFSTDFPEKYWLPEEPDDGYPQDTTPDKLSDRVDNEAQDDTRKHQISRQDESKKRRCDNYDKKVRDLAARMRQSHSGSKGAELRKQRRMYHDLLYKECRN